MKNHNQHIESLLEQFMLGETSLEQERELSEFFANSSSIPKEWEAYREMFAYFDAGMPLLEKKPKRSFARPLWTLMAIAAAAAIAIMVAPHLQRAPIKVQTTIPPHITTENSNKTTPDTIVTPEQSPQTPLLAKQEHKTTKEKVRITSHQAPLDSIEIEREKGEMEQAQQELMADKFIIEQERQEILDEQYATRAQAQIAQQAMQNENPQFINVVFK